MARGPHASHQSRAAQRGGGATGWRLLRPGGESGSRLRALAQGGHVLLSQGTAELVADQLPPSTSLADVGEHYLKGCLELSTVRAGPSRPRSTATASRRDRLVRAVCWPGR